MMPADAINTQLFKHQMYALAWMSNRENSETVPGGILADDMGLGKTLTVLALIISNFHDFALFSDFLSPKKMLPRRFFVIF